MANIAYREYRPDDAESFLRLHDSCFPAMAAEFWREWSQGPITAAVAVLDGEVVGTVPFQFRDLRVRPDAVVRVAWEFSVCVREDLRGTGVGSRLMDTAKGFLPGRCAAMAVYRNDELSPPYRFYARNGHQDLLYMRPWVHRGPAVRSAGSLQIRAHSWEEFLADEAQYLAVFSSAFGAYGGFPQRQAGYYAPAVNTSEYNEVPVELTVLAQRDQAGSLQGYAVVGEERDSPTLHVMEMAALDNDLSIAIALLAAVTQLAAERGIKAVVSTADSSPYAAALRALGFAPASRSQSSMIIMAYPLDPERLAGAVWRESEATAGLEVSAWTPEREVCLHRARRDPATPIVLEMKEDTLARLLFSRLDLRAAIVQETVTTAGAGDADVEAIAQALPYTPWVYHYLDFV
jgi:GNAT superfamily N-acetyltransferase